LSRQKVAVFMRRGSVPNDEYSDTELLAGAEGLRRGAYVLAEASGGVPRALLLASGSELSIAIDARRQLEEVGIPARVVSMPSWYLFQKQDADYRDQVLPPEVKARVSVEAGSTFGWDRWVGSEGCSIGIDHFGASAPAEVLYERFGITTEAVVASARELLEQSQ